MWKRLGTVLLICISLTFAGCVDAYAGLKSYVDTADGYEFLYPNGWVGINVNSGPDVVFRDLIEETENVSVVISPITGNRTLTDIGTPSEVGYKLSQKAIAPPDSGRKAELIKAGTKEYKGKTYYLLEYAVELASGEKRHDVASVAISRGKLYTLNISTTDKRWNKVENKFAQVAKSFSVY